MSLVNRAARTAVTLFPYFNEARISAQQWIQNRMRIPFDKDFKALRLFPDIKDAIYLDIGGNRGFATDAILMHSSSCRVFYYEPNPVVFEKVKNRFKANPRVETANFALGDTPGNFILYIPMYRGRVFDGLASLNYEEARTWLGKDKILFFDEKKLHMRECRSEVRKLDDLGLDPFFVKLDVQGYELNVLRGGENTIRKSQPILLIESVEKGDSVLKYLEAFGYRSYRFDRNRFIRDETGSPNSFLMTEDKFRLLLSPDLPSKK